MKKIYLVPLIFLLFSLFGYAQTNLLKNPSFESSFTVASENFDDWYIHYQTTRAKVTDATDGDYAVKLQTNRSGSSGYFAQLSAATPSNDLTFEKDKTYSISFDYKIVTGSITEIKATLLRDDFYLEDEEFASNLNSGEWLTLSYEFTSSYDATHNFDITITGASASAEIILDNAVITEKTTSTNTDRDALVAFYNATNGDNWTTPWDLSADISTWYGVTLNSENRVRYLVLPDNNLTGTIPSEIGDLTYLEDFNLPANAIEGEIPEALFELTNLEVINLKQNDLSGEISNNIDQLTSIREIFLDGNQFTGSIPSSISNLNTLETVNLRDNQLSGSIPKELGDLASIQSINLSNNSISGEIPQELGNLFTLNELNVSSNDITGSLPSSFSGLTNLKTLSLGYNNFSGELPDVLWDITSLENLTLSHNEFSGQISSQIGNLTNLKTLYLDSNDFSGSFPSEIWNLTNLTTLKVEKLTLLDPWPIPTEIQNLTKLKVFEARNGNITGALPDVFDALTELTIFQVHDNKISGQIPASFESLTNLLVLGLSYNYLSGDIPVINVTGADVNIYGNNFNFKNIENVIATYDTNSVDLDYDPQRNIDLGESFIVDKGSNFQLQVTNTESENNIYQWKKDGVILSGQDSNTLNLSDISEDDSGSYICTITNPNVPGLTLETNPVSILVSQNDDIQILTTSTSCEDTDNGEITISFDKAYDYQVVVEGDSFNETFSDIDTTEGLKISGLAQGTYNVCVYMPNTPNFERCSSVNINSPEAFTSGKAVVNEKNKTAKLVVSGSKNYTVSINNKELNYSFNDTGIHELTFELEKGVNTILAKTDKSCQGEYEETYVLNHAMVSPNPVTADEANIIGLKNSDKATISITNTGGNLLKSLTLPIENGSLKVPVTYLPTGLYYINIKSKEQDVQTKLIKK
ncbi:leucine-rich repeat domain-containing protein [Maribacter thermophilus]|uniref:leucine-rich repeat domain-containing protein n=1 Tax=Maribacter thermophilus TaxID=1197874 RepID=UPI00069A502C|nr:T9SS type A sorting domain-containing protein [Maribacter thermophilus]